MNVWIFVIFFISWVSNRKYMYLYTVIPNSYSKEYTKISPHPGASKKINIKKNNSLINMKKWIFKYAGSISNYNK